MGVNGPGQGESFLVGKEGNQRKFAKAINHGENTMGGGVRVAKFIHAVECPDATWAWWEVEELASP